MEHEPTADIDARPPSTKRVSDAFARLVVFLRYLIIPGWIAAAVAANAYLPGVGEADQGSLSGLIPRETEAVRTELRSLELFRLPLLGRTVVVQRNRSGLSLEAQGRVLERAARLNLRLLPGLERIVGAIPVINARGVVPTSKEQFTTALTFLFYPPDTGIPTRVRVAHDLTREHIDEPGDSLVGITGAVPGRNEQAVLMGEALNRVQVATIVLILLVVGLTFRSLGAPVLSLLASGIAFVTSVRVVSWFGEQFGAAVPKELEPLILVLVLGVVTDYAIFFLSGMRDRLSEGDAGKAAARRTGALYVPIVVTAGLTTATSSAALLVADLEFLRAFGPGLALTILISMLVSITFIPAVLGLLGRGVFWPRRLGKHTPEGARVVPKAGRVATWASGRRAAVGITIVSVLVLAFAGIWVKDIRLGFSLVGDLPRDSEPRRAAAAASAGFAPGIISPTEILVEAEGIVEQRVALRRLEALIDQQEGVAGVLSPTAEPERFSLGLLAARSGDAVRFIVILDSDPLGGRAVENLEGLRERLPQLLRATGLPLASASFAGDTALIEETISRTLSDMRRVGVLILLSDLVLLALFLRAAVAPLYLVMASVLVLFATLGMTVVMFQQLVVGGGVTYYVPIAAAVLIVSLGSDYNIFAVGHIWEEARRRPLREAIAIGSHTASRAITIAAVTLALSFGLLAIVPLRPFRELAFTMFVGVLIDAMLVRSVMVPALVALFGAKSEWPSRRFWERRQPEAAPVALAMGDARRG